MKISSLEDLIRSKIPLGKLSGNGFYAVRCPCCNDYKERGGWRIETTDILYNCFNCGTSAGYSIDDTKISGRLKKVLFDFGFTESDLNQIQATNFFNKGTPESISLASLKKVNLFTPEIELPPNSRLLSYEDEKEMLYLINRHIDTTYPFYISNDSKFKDRIIIPFYKNSKLIYWQARTILDIQPRYLNSSTPKEAILFNHDELFKNYNRPLFVTEGVFDALLVNGLALIGSKLNEAKLEILAKSRRELIFIIDKDKNGLQVAKKVLEYQLGSITFSPGDKTDVNTSILKYGKLWTIYEMLKNKTSIKFNVDLLTGMNCR